MDAWRLKPETVQEIAKRLYGPYATGYVTTGLWMTVRTPGEQYHSVYGHQIAETVREIARERGVSVLSLLR